MDQKVWQGEDFFDERRIFRLDAKVSCCEIRIAGSDMHRFVISWRVGADEENALDKKKQQKTCDRNNSGLRFSQEG